MINMCIMLNSRVQDLDAIFAFYTTNCMLFVFFKIKIKNSFSSSFFFFFKKTSSYQKQNINVALNLIFDFYYLILN